MVIYCSIFYLYIIQKTVDINVFTAYYRGSFWIKKLSNTLREPKTKKELKKLHFQNNHYSQVVVLFVAAAYFANKNTRLTSREHLLVELAGTTPASEW